MLLLLLNAGMQNSSVVGTVGTVSCRDTFHKTPFISEVVIVGLGLWYFQMAMDAISTN